MTNKALSIPVQYVLHSKVETFSRPYLLQAGLSNTLQLFMDISALPHEKHYRLVLEAVVEGRSPDGILCMTTTGALEAIVVIDGMEPAEVDQALREIAAPSVLGSLRTLLTGLTQGTGFGAVVLPPMGFDQIANLPSRNPPPNPSTVKPDQP